MNYTDSLDHVVHAGTGQPMHSDSIAVPTVVSSNDMNMVIWSLMEVLKAANVSGRTFNPDDPGSYSRFRLALETIFATLDSPDFTGDPTVETPPQFDNSQRIASTEFVQRALGNRCGVWLYATSQAIGADKFGSYVEYTGATPATFTLPSAKACKGGVLDIFNGSNTLGAALTLTGGGIFYGPNAPGVLSIVLQPQVSTTIISDGTNWKVLNGAGKASLGASAGYRLEPNGLIEQWGVGIVPNSGTTTSSVQVTFPIAFPNACLNITGVFCEAFNSTGGGTWAIRPTSWTKEKFLATGDNNGPNYLFNKSATFFWRALGH
ncbi:phage tail protein [Cupriavidus gilardii]|uniref:gp53-like domain-containing protein n=1 Tax=Cupriavidus gilardii TaxID=82541 RepID=UPI0021C141A6|nr:phage tail protein [Cupriavidus gilardii]MCT9014627.1 phage tail protein [Cupriavidus gilardii]MCT9054347.1 phage tail protein [Cupriavidus gilardii]